MHPGISPEEVSLADVESTQRRLSVGVAATLASGAFFIPLALSASSAPSPNHPRVFLWYRLLRKPWFKPPDWFIPLAWFGIEASLAVGAYRLLRVKPSPAQRKAIGLLAWNVFMTGAWSRLFFKRRNLALSTAAAAAMIATGVGYTRNAAHADRIASRTGLPFVVWVGFATVLSAAIWRLNRRR